MAQDNEHNEEIKKRKEFIEHLERCTKIVSTWPAWKQAALGGPVVENPKLEKDPVGVIVTNEARIAEIANGTPAVVGVSCDDFDSWEVIVALAKFAQQQLGLKEKQ